MRIISLVPSISEYLWTLGLEEEVVGITKFCVHPNSWWKNKTRVGGTKNLNFQTIEALQPTLIIANKEENSKEDIIHLNTKFEVLLTDINSLDDAFHFLLKIGESVGKREKSIEFVDQLKRMFFNLEHIGGKTCFLYFIWKDPFYVVGPNTYIDSLLGYFGWSNYCKIDRYPALNAVLALDAHYKNKVDVIFLSSEPYPFEQKHIAQLQEIFPNSKIIIVDGEICSWYGSRMILAPSYMKKLQKAISKIEKD